MQRKSDMFACKLFCRRLIFSKPMLFFSSKSSRTPSELFVGPELGPKRLQKLSADGLSRQRVTADNICLSKFINIIDKGM